MTCHLLQSQEPEEGNPRQSSHSGPRKRECRSRCGFQSKGKRWLSWQEDSRKSISIHQLPFGVLLCVLLTPSCLILCNPMDCSLPGSFVYGILQARILDWDDIPFSRRIFLTRGSNLNPLQLMHQQFSQFSRSVMSDSATP